MQPKQTQRLITLGFSFFLGLFLILYLLPTSELMANANGDNIFFASTDDREVVDVDMDGPTPTTTPTAPQLPNCSIATPTPTITLPVVQREGITPTPSSTPSCVTVTPAASNTPTPSGANVTVSSNLFTPDSLTINVGESVTWENTGGFHNVVADDGSFTSGSPTSAPWSYSNTFDTAGSYQYYCSIHGNSGGVGMSGVVIVQDGSNTATPTSTAITNTPTVTGTPPTKTPTPFLTPTPGVTGTPPTSTPTPFLTPTPGVTGTPPTNTPTPFLTPTPSVTGTPPTKTPTPFLTPTPGVTGTPPTNTPTPPPTNTPTPPPTNSPTVTTTPATSTPTVTGTPPTNTPTMTPIPNCPTMTPSPNTAPSQAEGSTPTASPTSTPFCVTVTATVTTTPATSTPTVTGTPPTNTPTMTPIPNCPTMTPPNSVPSQAEGPTLTAIPTSTPFCVTVTPTVTGTPPTNTPTITFTPTGGSLTWTPTPSETPSSATPTITPSGPTFTPTMTEPPFCVTTTPVSRGNSTIIEGSAITPTPTATSTGNCLTLTPTPTNTPIEVTSTPTATATLSTSTPTATGTFTTTMTATPTAIATTITITTATPRPPVELSCNGTSADFEAGIPSNWMTEDNQGPVYWSTTEDTAACDNGSNNTPGSGFAACADADQTNQQSSTDYDAQLWTPAFDLSEVPTATLHFAAAYRDINPNGGDSFNVEVWDGSSWNNALSWNDDHRNPGEEVELDLSAYSGQNDVQVRFRYAGLGWDWWVQVDDIQLTCGELTNEASIALETTVGTEADVCATTDTITLPTGGQEVTYCYKVINTSNVTLTEHSLVDDQLGDLLTNQAQDLAPAASYMVLETATITTDTTNIATWTATDGNSSASASASAEVDIEPLCGATIQSVASGAWNDAATWDLSRVPNASDIVLIQDEHIVDGQSSANVAGFCNNGTLRSPQNQSLQLHASTFFKNYGDILGLDGEARSGTSCGTIGSSLNLRGKPFENEGTIQAGHGGEGEYCGGNGGSTTILGRDTSNSNSGLIAAGNGGDVSSTGSEVGAYVGGEGGDSSIRGNFEGSGFVDNDGTLQAGDGGNGHPNAAVAQDGGNGGCLYINASALYLNGNQWGGLGGTGTGGGQNGSDGCVSIDPSVIDLSGTNTSVRGGDIMIFGGDDWVLDLSEMSAGAISASNDLTLAVGENSTIDLTDNNDQIMDVAGNVTIASDNVQLDNGSDFSDVIDATGEISEQDSQIIYGVELNGPGQVIAEAKSKQVINLSVLNSGPMSDSYNLQWSNSAGWALGNLPDTITIGGLESQDIMLMLTPPAEATNGDSTTITLTATSQGDETQSTELSTLIVVEGGSFTIHLPLITN